MRSPRLELHWRRAPLAASIATFIREAFKEIERVQSDLPIMDLVRTLDGPSKIEWGDSIRDAAKQRPCAGDRGVNAGKTGAAAWIR